MQPFIRYRRFGRYSSPYTGPREDEVLQGQVIPRAMLSIPRVTGQSQLCCWPHGRWSDTAGGGGCRGHRAAQENPPGPFPPRCILVDLPLLGQTLRGAKGRAKPSRDMVGCHLSLPARAASALQNLCIVQGRSGVRPCRPVCLISPSPRSACVNILTQSTEEFVSFLW